MKIINWLPSKNRPDLQVYCSLAIASVMLESSAAQCFRVKIDSFNSDTQKFLWTALMMLGATATGCIEFKNSYITTSYTFNGYFKPEDELGWFGTFALNSLHNRVFLPVLAGKKVNYKAHERNLEFGHHVPEGLPLVKQEVQKIICSLMLRSIFQFDKNSMSIDPDQLYEVDRLGVIKLTQVMSTISREVTLLDFKGIQLTKRNLPLVAVVLKCLPEWITQINFKKMFVTPEDDGPPEHEVANIFENVKALTVDLSNNNLGKMLYDHAYKIIKLISRCAHTIVLNENKLGDLPGEKLINLFSAFSGNLQSLSLSYNHFYMLTANQLGSCFSQLSSKLQYLDISENNLSNLKGHIPSGQNYNGLGIFFISLKEGLMTLKLDEAPINKFAEGDDEVIDKRINSYKLLPKSIMHLYINGTLIEVGKLINSLNEGRKRFFAEKIDFELRNRTNRLHLFAKRKNTTVFEIRDIMSQGVEIDYQDSLTGDTALIASVKINNESVAEILLKNNADPSVKNFDGKMAYAYVSQETKIYLTLLGYQFLHATRKSDLNMLKSVLLLNKCIIDFQSIEGNTALLIAVEKSLLQIVIFLLKNNANCKVTRFDGKSVFDLAVNEDIKKELSKISSNSDNNENTNQESNDPYGLFNNDFLGLSDGEQLDPANTNNIFKPF